MRRNTLALLLTVILPAATACRDEAVGVGDMDASAPMPDAAPDERCLDWSPPAPGELAVWNSSADAGERHVAAAVGKDGTILAVWATGDGVWCRARCHNGAPLREGGLDTRLDDGAAVSLIGPHVLALANGGFVVTWRDDTDASIRAAWVDAVGGAMGPALQINSEEAPATGRPPRGIQLTDGDVLFLWSNWLGRYSSGGVPHGATPQLVYPGIQNDATLAAAAGVDGSLLQLRSLDPPPSPTTAIELRLTTWAFSPAGSTQFVHNDDVWPHLWNWGRRGYVLASVPDLGRAAVIWPGNWPYEVWFRWVGEDGLCDGDGMVVGDGGDDASEDGWMDLALDGLGRARVVWRTADAAREIRTWSEAEEDQLLMSDWGDRAHFPRVAGYPAGGFLLLLSPGESHPDEDVLFTVLDR